MKLLTLKAPHFRAFLAILARYALLYVLFVILRTGKWFERTFERVDLDQILYHLQQSPEGLLRADASLVREGVSKCLVAPLAYALLALIVAASLPRLRRAYFTWPVQVAAFTMASSWVIHSAVAIQLPDRSGGDWLQAHYAMPRQPVPPAHRRNLLLIYSESLETAYHADPMARLPAQESVSYDEFAQLPGTGWTIAGIVASQCALPLKPLGIFGHNALGESTARFLPKARCLGDVLKAAGYRSEFIGGASTQFAGKGRFLSQHGYDQVLGREHWVQEMPGAPLNEWGLNDDLLLEQALRRLRTLTAAGQPFNLTVLTLGMHPPNGHLSPSCPVIHSDFSDTVQCTERLLRRFVESAEAEGLLTNTDVFLMGDHLTMPMNQTGRQLAKLPHRSVYNRMLTSSHQQPNRTRISHFDIAPTLLVALGFAVGDGRFGLGCAALGKVACTSMAEMPDAETNLKKHSAFYDGLWSDS